VALELIDELPLNRVMNKDLLVSMVADSEGESDQSEVGVVVVERAAA